MSGSVQNIAGSALGSIISRQGSSSGSKKPKEISTGFSSFTNYRRKPKINLDSSIRAGQKTFLTNVRGIRDMVNPAFDAFQGELGGLRDELGGLRADLEGNQSAYREAVLRPTTEAIAARRQGVFEELGKTNVRGSFRDQSITNFELRAGEKLSDVEAKIENERIGNLSRLLGMDAEMLKASLSSEQGRINMLMDLEESLKGISTERFNQEMRQLNLAMGIAPSDAQIRADQNRLGIERSFNTQLAGDILEGLGSLGGGTGAAYDSGFGSSLVLPGNPHSA